MGRMRRFTRSNPTGMLFRKPPVQTKGQRIGVIGSGVAGLTAAYLLQCRREVLLYMLLIHPFMPHRISVLIRRHGATLWLTKAPMTVRTPQTAGGRLDG